LASCSIIPIPNHKSRKKIKIGDLTIYLNRNDKFHFLKVIDEKRTFNFIYPVGNENFEYRGELFYAQKIYLNNSKSYRIISGNTLDSVCFLSNCYKKNGSLIEFDTNDRNLIQKLDSFCRANYSFYKIDIKEFKKWYSPYE